MNPEPQDIDLDDMSEAHRQQPVAEDPHDGARIGEAMIFKQEG